MILVLICNLNLFGQNIDIKGNAIKILDNGKRTKYFHNNGEQIALYRVLNNKLITKGTIYSKGGFDLKSRISNKYIGEEFQLRTTNDWFILFPLNGKFFLPKKSLKIKIVLINRNSQIYQELFKIIDYYSIQTFATKSYQKAELQLQYLRDFCKRNGKNSFYCKKYVRKVPVVQPNKDTFYRINYKKYKSIIDANRDLAKIKKIKYLEKSFIVQYPIIDTNFIKY